jgi:hypothetical protein
MSDGLILAETSEARLNNLYERYKNRAGHAAMTKEGFLEEIIDLGCHVQQQRWEAGDRARNQKNFAKAIESLNVVKADGAVDGALLGKLMNKYKIGGTAAQV